jgi:hypothetical protein
MQLGDWTLRMSCHGSSGDQLAMRTYSGKWDNQRKNIKTTTSCNKQDEPISNHNTGCDDLVYYLISLLDGNKVLWPGFMPILLRKPGKTFQNRRDSSPAPVTTLCPSGDIAKYSTLPNAKGYYEWESWLLCNWIYLIVWPVKVACFCMLGYFHTIIWFSEYPCVDTISLTVEDQTRLQT